VKKIFVTIAVFALLVLAGAGVMSLSWAWYEDFEQLASAATDVVRVEALDEREEWLNPWLGSPPPEMDPYRLYTIHRLLVLEVLQGETRPGDIIEVAQMAAVQGDWYIPGMEESRIPFATGDDLILFLEFFDDAWPAVLVAPHQSAFWFPSRSESTEDLPLDTVLESVLLGDGFTIAIEELVRLAEANFGGMNEWPFVDVAETHWARRAIVYVFENDIMTGTTTTTFAPNAPLTRAQLATILWRMDGSPAVTYRPIFRDVAPDRWYSSAVIWAFDRGIVTGTGPGSFAPGDNITREQFATMLHRYAQPHYWVSVQMTFPDADQISRWAWDAVHWAVANNIIRGTNGMLNARGTASRAEVATMLVRYMDEYAG